MGVAIHAGAAAGQPRLAATSQAQTDPEQVPSVGHSMSDPPSIFGRVMEIGLPMLLGAGVGLLGSSIFVNRMSSARGQIAAWTLPAVIGAALAGSMMHAAMNKHDAGLLDALPDGVDVARTGGETGPLTGDAAITPHGEGQAALRLGERFGRRDGYDDVAGALASSPSGRDVAVAQEDGRFHIYEVPKQSIDLLNAQSGGKPPSFAQSIAAFVQADGMTWSRDGDEFFMDIAVDRPDEIASKEREDGAGLVVGRINYGIGGDADLVATTTIGEASGYGSLAEARGMASATDGDQIVVQDTATGRYGVFALGQQNETDEGGISVGDIESGSRLREVRVQPDTTHRAIFFEWNGDTYGSDGSVWAAYRDGGAQ